MSDERVRLVRDEQVLIVTIANPPVNALSPGVAEAVEAAIRGAVSDEEVRAVVPIGDGNTFVAGADIKVRGQLAAGGERSGPDTPGRLCPEGLGHRHYLPQRLWIPCSSRRADVVRRCRGAGICAISREGIRGRARGELEARSAA